jgi:hypothetical protein
VEVRNLKKIFVLLVLALSALAVSASGVSASNSAIVISFDKHSPGDGHYVGTACNGGTIDMQLSNSSVTGNVQQFTATVRLVCPGRGALTAVLDGRFNFSTGKTVLNGVVVDGWLAGAQVHEEGQFVGRDPDSGDPYRFVGTVQLMPGSAD